jgi:3'-5' exoribonuclease
MLIQELHENQPILAFFMLNDIDCKNSTNGKKYFSMTLADTEFQKIDAKKWDVKPDEESAYQSGDVVKVKGNVKEYKGNLQIIVQQIRKATESDTEININDFVETPPVDIETMYNEITGVVSEFKNEDLKKLTKKILKNKKDELMYFPAAKRHHHAIKGGLLYHIYSMLKVGQAVAGLYDFLNKELLYTGIILHDISKTDEIESNMNGSVSQYTKEGKLLGHIIQGIVYIGEIGHSQGINPEVITLVQHMILSHHYFPEYGSPKMPLIPEAEMLHHIDMIDARMYTMSKELEGLSPGEFGNQNWSIDGRTMYKSEIGS